MSARISEVTMLPLRSGFDELLIPELVPMIDATRQFAWTPARFSKFGDPSGVIPYATR